MNQSVPQMNKTHHAINHILALEFFPKGMGRQDRQDRMLALEYFPDEDSFEVTEVTADSQGTGLKDNKKAPTSRRMILKSKGKNKVPSSMQVINLREHS